MVRAPFYDKNGIKKGAWSEEEDNMLRACIQRYGHWNWRAVSKFAGLKRCGKSCRLRWLNYLRPGVKHGNYSKEEDDLIIRLHEKLGSKWSVIASKLPGRTDNEIKNYWHTHLKKRNQANIRSEVEGVTRETSNTDANIFDETKLELKMEPINISSDASFQEPFEASSMDASSCSVSDYGLQTGMDCTAEDSTGSSGMTTETCDLDFWTQPFLEDKFDMQSFGFRSPLEEEVRYYCSYLGENPYMYYIDDADLFSPWMRENFP